MSDAPASPSAGRLATPSWLDARLVLGVLLVLVSVVVGARVLAAADQTQLVWAAARDLAPGTALEPGDLEAREVRLFATGQQYLAAPDQFFVGYVLDRPVLAGELLPTLLCVELHKRRGGARIGGLVATLRELRRQGYEVVWVDGYDTTLVRAG